MANAEGGQTNLAMDMNDVDDIDLGENNIQSTDASNTPSHDQKIELSLRVDKLANEMSNVGIFAGTDGVQADVATVDVPGTVGFSRDRPFSASTRSRATVASSRSRVSMSPSITTTDFVSHNLFAYKMESFNKALADCTATMVHADPDGQVQGAWLLTEIDHWDNEKERLVMLTDNSLLIIKYDFIKLQPIEGKRIPLISIKKLQIGDLVYPPNSFMRNRDYGGVRIYYGDPDAVSFSQRWNPWSRSMPFVTLTHHLLAYNRHENETVTYNADDLAESLVAAVDGARRRFVGGGVDDSGEYDKIAVDDSPIVIDSYLSLVSVIHNQSKLGFYLERGGVSF